MEVPADPPILVGVGEHEIDALRRLALFLLTVGCVRLGLAWAPVGEPLVIPSGAASDSLLAATQRAVEEKDRRTRPLEQGERIDVNRAGEEDLDRLPRVGPSLARAIVSEREENGAFSTVEDLVRVPGLGSATVERLRSHIDVGGRAPRGPSPGAREKTAAVSLGAATAEDLQGIPGIGPALAARILAARARQGGFERVEDLLQVPGIGPVTLERIRPHVRVP